MKAVLTAAALVAATGTAAVAAPSSSDTVASDHSVAVPVLDQKCATNRDMAHLMEKVRQGHAVSGTWTLRPTFTCSEAESGLSVRAVLARNGTTLLDSSGSCAQTVPSCTTVAGPTRVARLGTSVRGTYVIHLTVTLTGVDAALAKGCTYDAPTLTATCTADSAPIRVR